KTHPFEYPESGLLSGPHFSGLIGATHADGYTLFAEGTKPTMGLERLSEEGKHNPLDEEIKAAIKAGKVGELFETGPIKDATEMKAEMVEFTVTDKYPMVSAVAMIAPSPDWFAGVANVNLMENGKWVQTKTIELYAFDSGGDDGRTYKASDVDTNPKKQTMKAMNQHFVVDGKARPVATLTFTLKK
ncbi:MAG: spondin domain-containing protein, partial [Ignavibacteriae bacterium]|nr:spondin domain-containing protein [Ignavibacteriota bacterium]